jgi:hypothetical protein
MKRIAFAAFACALALGVVGCMMPKEVTAKLNIKKDSGYVFAYEGSVVSLAMLSDLEGGKMDKAAEKKVADDIVGEMKKDKNLSSVAYAGAGVFTIVYKAEGNVNEAPLIVGMREMPFFALAASDDGSRAVFQFLPDCEPEILKEEFPASGLSPKGTIELITELPVESSVGDPAKAALSNTYTWKVDGIDGPLPAMTLKLK